MSSPVAPVCSLTLGPIPIAAAVIFFLLVGWPGAHGQTVSSSTEIAVVETLRQHFHLRVEKIKGGWEGKVPESGFTQRNLQDAIPWLKQLRGLSQLSLTWSKEVVDLSPLGAISWLRELDLSRFRKPDLTQLAGLKALERLTLNYCENLTSLNGIENLSALNSLQLQECGALVDIGALDSVSTLIDLDLSGCTALVNVKGLNQSRALQSLDLMGCDKLQRIDSLAGALAIRSLNMQNCLVLENIDAIGDLKALVKLNLQSCRGLTSLVPLKALSALQDLDISLISRAAQQSEVLRGLVALRHLDLQGWDELTNLDSLENMKALRELNVSSSDRLVNLDSVKNLHALAILNLGGCKSLEDVAVLANITSLRQLDLRGCSKIPAKTVAELKAILPLCEIQVD